MRLPFYCPIKDDEHLLSWFMRYHILSGRRTIASSLGVLGVSRSRLKSYDFNAAFLAVSKFYRSDFDKSFAVTEHSPLALWSLSHGSSYFSAWKLNEESSLKSVFEPNKLGILTGWSYCRHCAEEDRESNGFSYWHTEHQVPGTVLCQKHNQRLVVDRQGLTDINNVSLPHSCVNADGGRIEGWMFEWNDFVLHVFHILKRNSDAADKLTMQVPEILGLSPFKRLSDNDSLQTHQERFDEELPAELLKYLFKFYCQSFKRQPMVLRSTLGYKVYEKGKHPVYWLAILYWLRHQIDWSVAS
ncbi:TniQ family protein [Rheinheimera sp.]|uniref:TniQ family protein n=1 Tax=Rheinheimera sp. TaxID=1869214 RepID=UPI002355FF90|nr:TniQ family protein [Rheinheimera sp.]